MAENRAYEYDAAGQMTRVADTAAAVTKTFAWDPLGRMTHAEVNNGGVTKSVDYANNPAGKRFMRVAGGVTKAWTYQGDNIASVESTTSPTLHSVYSGSGLGGVVERDDVDTAGGGSTTSRFYLYNHRGDVVGVCDASGTLTSAYDYDAYGAVSQSVQSGGGSAPTDDVLFTGKDLDPDTGLYYFNARWYDSECGRFVSRTGLRPDMEGPYSFCEANPVGLVDVGGLIGVDPNSGTPQQRADLQLAIDELIKRLKSGTSEAKALIAYYNDLFSKDILDILENNPKLIKVGTGQAGSYSPWPGNDIWVLPAPSMECRIGSLLHETGHWINDISKFWEDLDPPLGKYQHYWDERPGLLRRNKDQSPYGWLPELIFFKGKLYNEKGEDVSDYE